MTAAITSRARADEASDAQDVLEALHQRLGAVSAILLDHSLPVPEPDVSRQAARLLKALIESVHAELSPSRLWLLLVAISGRFPSTDELLEALRTFQLEPAGDITLWLLDTAVMERHRDDAAYQHLRVVRGGVLVDVDHTAQHDLHTGIQQVVRRTLPIWVRDHDVVPVVWTAGRSALRDLTAAEQQRVLAWSTAGPNSKRRSATRPEPRESNAGPNLVVPWNCTVALFEVPLPGPASALAAVAQYSGNQLVAIGYDCIPIISAASVPFDDRFPEYLSIIKHAHRIAGISVSATVEFQGFANMLPTQGLPGPRVIECQLAAESLAPEAVGNQHRHRPLVLSVGSFEPRKNGLALLYSAERLWREGLDFDLTFIGGSTWGDEFPERLAQLQAQGRPVVARRGVRERELVAAYQQARFTVFASLHEGYGLPVAESLGAGTPVITADYGSTHEIAASGGALMIDPRDDDALTAAIRDLLTDDALLERLRAQLPARPTRTWEQYAAELWTGLIEGSA